MAEGGIPRESFARFRDKVFGEQIIRGIQLLSMTKNVTQEGFYHCEAEYDFSQSRDSEESSEELVEEIDKKEEPSLSTEKRPLNREQENASTLSSYPTTISDTANLEAETPRKLSTIEFPDSDASPSSATGGKLEPDPTMNIYSAPTVLESDINRVISSPSQSTTTVSNMSTTKVESSWCSTKSGHPCAFPFSWNSYTWHRSLFPFNVLESPKQLRAFVGMSLM